MDNLFLFLFVVLVFCGALIVLDGLVAGFMYARRILRRRC
jgi:hypothetical protein